jgi:hypothetical protein
MCSSEEHHNLCYSPNVIWIKEHEMGGQWKITTKASTDFFRLLVEAMSQHFKHRKRNLTELLKMLGMLSVVRRVYICILKRLQNRENLMSDSVLVL